MSADKKRLLRTQGRFSSSPQQLPESKQKQSAKERNDETKGKNDGTNDSEEERVTQDNREIDKRSYDLPGQQSILPEGTVKVTYQENCPYTATPFDQPKRPEEIKEYGLKILSESGYGESRIYYYPRFIEMKEAYDFFDKFVEKIPWRHLNIMIHGREYRQPRLVAWFGPFPYSYSGVILDAEEMPDDVLQIKSRMENFLAQENINVTFNSVLLNLYRDGADSVAWHSDDELSMGIDPTIASISLGEVRRFEMRRKPTQQAEREPPPVEYFVNLKHGSLLIMDGVMQMDWQHRVPKETFKVRRINLTFRTVYKDKRLLKAKK